MAPRRWVSKPTLTSRGGKTCCARSATNCSGWMKPQPTGCTPAADAATDRTRRSTRQDRGEDRNASDLLSTIRAKDSARALEARGFHQTWFGTHDRIKLLADFH